MCPKCQAPQKMIVKKGFYKRQFSQRKKVQRYQCNACRKTFHIQKTLLHKKNSKAHYDEIIFNLMNSGISQRRCAQILGINKTTIARKIIKLGIRCRKINATDEIDHKISDVVVFDEMETFEHSKFKPLSIAVAVQEKSRKIISVHVSQMPPKGIHSERARKRYGVRSDNRRAGLEKMMEDLKQKAPGVGSLKSDECPRYPRVASKHFPNVSHFRFKGRRACVVGLGELKAGGYDELFALNHSCAMIRDNLKRLSRKTWCTTKDRRRLQDLLDMYVTYHNAKLDKKKRLVDIDEAQFNRSV